MVFTVRLMLGTVLVLLCCWSVQSAHLIRPIRQANSDGEKTEAENATQSIVANLTREESNKPKTEDNTTIDKQNSVVGKLQKSDSFKKIPEIARSIDIEKYVSKEFHNKNNVYSLPHSEDADKFVNPGYEFHATTDDYHSEHNYHAELTTPKSSYFDHKYKEAVESVDQKLEHIDSYERPSESTSKENVNLDKLYEETKKNDTKADLNYINYKSITANDTGSKNSLHKDLVVEAGTNLDFHSSYNHTVVIDEDDTGNNTIAKEPETSTLSNVIPSKGDLDHAESVTSKASILTTRKSITLTKPPSNRNSSHISILSNNIETETVKAINPVQTTEKSKGETEVVSEEVSKSVVIEIAKRPVVSTAAPNSIKKSESMTKHNQVIPTTESQIEVLLTTEKEVTTEKEITTEKQATTEKEITTEKQVATAEKAITTEKQVATAEKEITTEKPATTEKEITTEKQVTTEKEITTEKQFIVIAKATAKPEIETVTSTVTETSVSPWEISTTQATPLIETETPVLTTESITTVTPAYLADSTETTKEETTTLETTTSQIKETRTDLDVTTTIKIETTTLEQNEIKNSSITTESSVRTSKEMVFRNVTLPTTTQLPEVSTVPQTTTEIVVETTHPETTIIEAKTEELETTTAVVAENHTTHVLPMFKQAEQTDSSTDVESTTDNNTMTSETQNNSSDDNSGTIAAITISSIGAVCLILLAGLLVIMRKRQKRFNYGQRCTPVSLDDYSMDNVSVYNSVRRKGLVRGSKRSYGNPAFEDPVCLSHPLNFPALGKFANNLEDMKAEFEEIPLITARTNELPEGCDTKNRYANVIPLPETRVFLTLIDGYPNSDYINANYVTGPKNTKGYYIACQAPLQNTVDDFWRMIWEQQCKVILMLTHLFENGVEKCVDYLPPSEVLDCHRLFGDFQVTLKKREVKDKYIISSLQLKNMVSNSWREVTHFWYLGWPERGVPTEANSLIAFLIEARSYMKSSSLDRKDDSNGNLTNGMAKNELNPVVVHCSPGTGRTGVVIACDIAIREFEQNRLVDVPRIVYKIRRDRASAVQTKEQYAFIYKVINLYATKLTGGALDSL